MATAPPMPKSFEDAQLRQLEVEKELERVCSAVPFRTSKRACEFLRYVVRVTLDGRIDSLKERSIGIDLLGRDISYDPSSDAIVRVRANDVRKRLSSYYASAELVPKIQINLPTGSYIPSFMPGRTHPEKELPLSVALPPAIAPAIEKGIPPLSRLALMRPALLALLFCTLLMRHRLEDREPCLLFWDHILSGRNTLLLSVASQDRAQLAPSLYPIVWIAGRYGVDTAVEEIPATGEEPEQIASILESLSTPTLLIQDKRVRWVLISHSGSGDLTDRNAKALPSTQTASAALLTILPEDAATLHIQGTDSGAIQHLLEELTSQKHFPNGLIDLLGNRQVLQVLLRRDSSGQWQTQSFSEGS